MDEFETEPTGEDSQLILNKAYFDHPWCSPDSVWTDVRLDPEVIKALESNDN